MTRIEKVVEIKAPVEEVFDFVADWRNKSSWYVGVLDWKPTTELTRGLGAKFAFKTKLMGVSLETEMVTTGFVQNEKIEYSSIRGLRLERRVVFAGSDDGTRVTDISEYKLPVPVLGTLIDALVVRGRQTAHAEQALQNLKRLTEE